MTGNSTEPLRGTGLVQHGLDGGFTVRPQHEPSMWLREQMKLILRRFTNGSLRSCPHPGHRMVALWAPDKLRCGACAVPAEEARSDAHGQCDRCNQRPARELIGLGVFATDRIIVETVLCEQCAELEGLPLPVRESTDTDIVTEFAGVVRRSETEGGIVTRPDHTPSDWLASVVRELAGRLVDGTLTQCPATHPAPRLVSLHNPDRLRCGPCYVDNYGMHGRDAAACDRCGDVPEPANQLTGFSYRAMPTVLLLVELCPACATKEDR